MQAHEPPASLVPRLHALVIRHMEHNNPSLSPQVDSESYKKGKLISSNFYVTYDLKDLRIKEFSKKVNTIGYGDLFVYHHIHLINHSLKMARVYRSRFVLLV